jgi:hypothetical protein
MIIDYFSGTKIKEAVDTYKDHDSFKDRIIKTIMKATGYINDRYDL